MSEVKFEFEDLPEGAKSGTSPGKYKALTDALKANPGKWVRLEGRRSGTMASVIQRGTLKDFNPPGAYEAKSRNHSKTDHRSDIYVRYVGTE